MGYDPHDHPEGRVLEANGEDEVRVFFTYWRTGEPAWERTWGNDIVYVRSLDPNGGDEDHGSYEISCFLRREQEESLDFGPNCVLPAVEAARVFQWVHFWYDGPPLVADGPRLRPSALAAGRLVPAHACC